MPSIAAERQADFVVALAVADGTAPSDEGAERVTAVGLRAWVLPEDARELWEAREHLCGILEVEVLAHVGRIGAWPGGAERAVVLVEGVAVVLCAADRA